MTILFAAFAAGLALMQPPAHATTPPVQPPSADAGAACVAGVAGAVLRMNDITAVGTHNSYKLAIPADELRTMIALDSAASQLDYAHRPLVRQMEAGSRQLEIDVLHDPRGGRYARPLTISGAGAAVDTRFTRVMSQPGFKVLHMQDMDFRSSCLTFVACLQEIDLWSRAHPGHVPLLIMLNAKTGPSWMPDGPEAPAFDAAAWDALDAEIRSVFADTRLVTPDEVRGGHPTLRDAVLANGWPTLAQARGRVFFALDEGPATVASYTRGRPSLQGRAMFVNTDETSPAAAYLTLNDPIAQFDRIQAAVSRGFIVRTRADAETLEARSGDTRRRDAALSSGAQYVSTDYFWPDLRFTGYEVRLPGSAAARHNPVRQSRCRDVPLETVAAQATEIDTVNPDIIDTSR